MRSIRTIKIAGYEFSLTRRRLALAFLAGLCSGLIISGGVSLVRHRQLEVREAARRLEDARLQTAREAREAMVPNLVAWERMQAADTAKATLQPMVPSPFNELRGEVRPNQTLGAALMDSGLNQASADTLVRSLDGLLDFRRIRAGETFVTHYDPATGVIQRFEYRKSRTFSIVLQRDGQEFKSSTVEPVTETVVVPVMGEVRTSLASAMAELGETAALTEMVADVFAWDINFYSDSRTGDKFRLLVEKVLADGQFLRYGRILAAEYEGYFTGPRYAFRYEIPAAGPASTTSVDYYDETGNSLRRSFLKAPLSTVRITSVFGFRMHPILHQRKPHLGVDFGAPMGTPVYAVADGVVKHAGPNGACGREIFIQHAMNYRTRYCHLSGINVRTGQRVSQKQVIGAVGSTGRSTGPHLHYELHQNGKQINPLKAKFERGKPVPKQMHADYTALAGGMQQKLFSLGWPRAQGPELPDDADLNGQIPAEPGPTEDAQPLGDE